MLRMLAIQARYPSTSTISPFIFAFPPRGIAIVLPQTKHRTIVEAWLNTI